MTDDVQDWRAVLDGRREWAVVLGDCLDVLRELPAGSVDAVVTDPPYGHGSTPKRGGARAGSLDYTRRTGGVVIPWDVADDSWMDLWHGPAAVFTSVKRCFVVAANLRADGMLAYVKTNPLPMGSSFEPCITRGFGVGARHVSAYNAANGQQHPTQKPIDVMRFVVGRAPQGVILDPFAGSGTTGVACLQTGRRFIGVEIDPTYHAIAVERLTKAAAARQPALPLEGVG